MVFGAQLTAFAVLQAAVCISQKWCPVSFTLLCQIWHPEDMLGCRCSSGVENWPTDRRRAGHMSAWVKGQQRWDLSQTRQWLCSQEGHAKLPVWGGGVGIGHATWAKCKHLKRLLKATFVDRWTCPSSVLTRGDYGKVKTLKCWQILTKPIVVIILQYL